MRDEHGAALASAEPHVMDVGEPFDLASPPPPGRRCSCGERPRACPPRRAPRARAARCGFRSPPAGRTRGGSQPRGGRPAGALRKRQGAVDFKVERQRQLLVQMLYGDVMHRDVLALRDEEHALAHGLVRRRDWPRLNRHIGAGKHSARRERRLCLDVSHLLDAERARHIDCRLDEMLWTDGAEAHVLDAEDARHASGSAWQSSSATPSGARSTSALIVCVTRRSASTAISAATADRRGGVAPGIAESNHDEAAEHGERGEHVGREVQRVSLQRGASRLLPYAPQRTRTPGVDADLDKKNGDRDDAQRLAEARRR